MSKEMRLLVFGLSLSSSWGNGHATTYRALLRAFAQRGHSIHFFEQDAPWYASRRDLPDPDFCHLTLYRTVSELEAFKDEIRTADAVIVGSYVPQGVALGRWIQAIAQGLVAFYDIDTPVTLAKLDREDFEYLTPEMIKDYDLYLSFTGGPVLDLLEKTYHARAARALYCSVDPEKYRPVDQPKNYDLGYLGTYSKDRQPALERLLLEPARRSPHLRYVVAGPQYPAGIEWPNNVEHIDHIPPSDHASFYSSCRYTLNVTREDMIRLGFSPSVRLFEAAACGTPIISDNWQGLETILTPEREILLPPTSDAVLKIFSRTSEEERQSIADAARSRILKEHSAAHRAAKLENYLQTIRKDRKECTAMA